jgi:hypothetical protein
VQNVYACVLGMKTFSLNFLISENFFVKLTYFIDQAICQVFVESRGGNWTKMLMGHIHWELTFMTDKFSTNGPDWLFIPKAGDFAPISLKGLELKTASEKIIKVKTCTMPNQSSPMFGLWEMMGEERSIFFRFSLFSTSVPNIPLMMQMEEGQLSLPPTNIKTRSGDLISPESLYQL